MTDLQPSHISTLLIANRGEIACRIIATAQQHGIRTIAIFSEADRHARHVMLADNAYYIGPAPAQESYLKGDVIIQIAKDSGADAIHPGYGFLSENPDFADAVQAAGLIFVGPNASAIREMGLKDAAKTLMAAAGVPVVPGYQGSEQSADFLKTEAAKIGYPVLLKARAGGGGKGMKLIETEADLDAGLASARREAESSFGDGHMILEKYIQSPRHIEVQVFSDRHGTHLHLFERDCSLQRRHQKVIEEAPAPDMPDTVRAAMTAAAVTAAKAIDYVGAGTIEFIVDGSGPLHEDGFWFMEMNTRLQVEHPVTEMVTGIDLVAWQLLVAQNKPLPVTQDEITISGHALEVRLYAENPADRFLPAPGPVRHFSVTDETVRVDTGILPKDSISAHYDPMIAKLITAGETREEAFEKMCGALRKTHFLGTVTNADFLLALCEDKSVRAAAIDTGLIARTPSLLTPTAPPEPVLLIAELLLNGSDIRSALRGWRLWDSEERQTCLLCNNERYERQLIIGSDISLISANSSCVAHKASCHLIEGYHHWQLRCDGALFDAEALLGDDEVSISTQDGCWRLSKPNHLQRAALIDTDTAVTAPMTATIRSVMIDTGAHVVAGQCLMILEAMKMEHEVIAPRDCMIAALLCAEGDSVSGGQILIEIQEEEDAE
jgi:3-methylcrotonyl-CoA carboxylase alpha subunit